VNFSTNSGTISRIESGKIGITFMEIKKYLNQIGIDYKQAAQDIGCHPVYFNTIVNGAKPGPNLAIEIEKWSGGQVSRSELRPDLWPK